MEYTTDFTDQDLLNSDGCQVEYYFDIEHKRGVGILTVENGLVYVCQNYWDGWECTDKKGFEYSYQLELNNSDESHYYKKIIQKLYKPKSLVGRYLKALVDNAQGTDYKKGEYVKITNDYNANYQVSIGIFGANISEISIWELMPEGFEPNQNSTVLGVELVKGEYYVGETSYSWVMKFDKIEDNVIINQSSIYLASNNYYLGGKMCDVHSIKSISKANFSERLWLDKCIAAGKFIPKEEALEEVETISTPIDKPTHEYEKLRSYIKDEAMKSLGMTALLSNNPGTTVSNLTLNYHNHSIIDIQKTKSDLEFQEPIIIKSIKNKPKLIIINN